MIKKVFNIIMFFLFFSFVSSCFVFGQGSHKGEGNLGALMSRKGTATQVFNVPNYTYIELEEQGGRVWIAAPTVKIKVGDRVVALKGIEMRDFHSEVLGRTFPVIHFVGLAELEGKTDTKTGDKVTEKVKTASSPVKGSIVKAKDGYTIEEIFIKKQKLVGKKITVRAKVVKASGEIMGKKWFHMQDGTGTKRVEDLVVTSSYNAEAGDIVLVSGILRLNKSFGEGYNFDLMLENAEIKADIIEKSKTSMAPKKGSIVKAKGGYTVEEIFEEKERLNGKEVKIRGKVVKASTKKIMNRRWVHMRDGTGDEGRDDLVITTNDSVSVGEIVLATGVLSLGKEFGPNYKYDVILENTKIETE